MDIKRMNDYYVSLSPPSDDYKVPSKRGKMNTIDSPTHSLSKSNSLSEKEWSSQRRELSDLRRRILAAGAITSQFQSMRVRIEEIIREEERNWEMRVDVDRETMERLVATLEKSMSSTGEDPEAQTFVETEMSQIKRRMGVKITNFLAENPDTNRSIRVDSPNSPKAQENGTGTQKELSGAEENVDIELSQLVKDEWMSQGSNCDALEEASIGIEEFYSEIQGEELSSPEEVIPTLRGSATDNLVLEDQIVSIRKDLSDTDRSEQLQIVFPRKLNGSTVMISPSFQYYGSSDCGIPSTAVINGGFSPQTVQWISLQGNGQANANKPNFLWEPPTDNQESAPEVLNDIHSPPPFQLINDNKNPTAKKPRQDLQIKVGNYDVRVSDSRFFEIDWKPLYTQENCSQFICNDCLEVKFSQSAMQDHIWFKHYGGGFGCPFCPDPRFMKWGQSVGVHIKHFHPHAFPPRK